MRGAAGGWAGGGGGVGERVGGGWGRWVGRTGHQRASTYPMLVELLAGDGLAYLVKPLTGALPGWSTHARQWDRQTARKRRTYTSLSHRGWEDHVLAHRGTPPAAESRYHGHPLALPALRPSVPELGPPSRPTRARRLTFGNRSSAIRPSSAYLSRAARSVRVRRVDQRASQPRTTTLDFYWTYACHQALRATRAVCAMTRGATMPR